MFGPRWQDLRAKHASLLAAVAHFVEKEESTPTIDDVAGTIRFGVSIDGVPLIGVITLHATLVVCAFVAPVPLDLDRERELDRFLALANRAQRFACVGISSGEAFVRTSLDTDGIPVTSRALTTLTLPNQLFARFYLPALATVAVGAATPEDAAARAEDAWQSFIAAAAKA